MKGIIKEAFSIRFNGLGILIYCHQDGDYVTKVHNNLRQAFDKLYLHHFCHTGENVKSSRQAHRDTGLVPADQLPPDSYVIPLSIIAQ